MNSIVFGGIDSSDYGIYISGEGVWNAPERDAETIQIPGRNGEYVLDHGNFKNIEVTYPAFNQEASYNDFRTKVDNFRNAISSLKGYQRLTDSFHPDEYRMAAFIGGLEVDPILYNDKSMQTNIVFNCKPQRFLTSGETEQTVTSGATITNPTLFESHPLILVDGYGEFDINGEPITIQQGAVMGDTILDETINSTAYTSGSSTSFRLTRTINNMNVALNGDKITLGASLFSFMLENRQYSDIAITSATSQDDGKASVGVYYIQSTRTPIQVSVTIDKLTFTKGTSSSYNYRATLEYTWMTNDSGFIQGTDSWVIDINVNYNGNNTFTVSLAVSSQNTPALSVNYTNNWEAKGYESTVNSTKSALGQLYIDLDIGECYRIENGQYISINTATILPADLPTFNPGANTITYSNTFTSFKVTSRWWKV